MTIEDLAERLPNGFHDSRLKGLDIDYETNVLRLRLEIWTGDLAANNEEDRERYVPGELILSGLAFCVIEPPRSQDFDAGCVRIGIGPLAALKEGATTKLSEFPSYLHASCIFVSDWSACIYVAYGTARLENTA